METKRCPRCGEEKPLTEFNKNPAQAKGLNHYCKRCQTETTVAYHRRYPEKFRANGKRYREKYPERVREQGMKYRYGITIADYDRMLAEQGGGCWICGSTTAHRSHQIRLHVDHCAETKTVRGLLCGPCNNALGHFKHSPGLLSRAIDYLTKSRTKS